MISRGQHVGISLVLIMFYELRVFLQVRFFNDFFEKSKGKKRAWANPMGSKQCKSFYQIYNFTFLFIYALFCFLKKYET